MDGPFLAKYLASDLFVVNFTDGPILAHPLFCPLGRFVPGTLCLGTLCLGTLCLGRFVPWNNLSVLHMAHSYSSLASIDHPYPFICTVNTPPLHQSKYNCQLSTFKHNYNSTEVMRIVRDVVTQSSHILYCSIESIESHEGSYSYCTVYSIMDHCESLINNYEFNPLMYFKNCVFVEIGQLFLFVFISVFAEDPERSICGTFVYLRYNKRDCNIPSIVTSYLGDTQD